MNIIHNSHSSSATA